MKIADLAPTNPLMVQPWADGLMWAIKQPDMLAAFRADAGCNWQPPKCAIDVMIDEATGANARVVEQFVRWYNAKVWGEVNGRACNGDEPEETEPK